MAVPDRDDMLHEIERVLRGKADLLETRRIVFTGLDHPDLDVRMRAAAAGWYGFDDEALVDRLLWIGVSDEDPRVRGQCLAALGRVLREGRAAGFEDPHGDAPPHPPDFEDGFAARYAEVRRTLLDRLRDPGEHLEVRRYALESLANLPDPAVAQWIRTFARHPEEQGRASAAHAMGVSGDPAWEPVLASLLGDPSRGVRMEAMQAVGWLQFEGLRSRVEPSCFDADPEVARAASEAMADLLPLEEAYQFLRDIEPRVAPAAREAVRHLVEELGYDLVAPREAYDDNGHDSDDALL